MGIVSRKVVFIDKRFQGDFVLRIILLLVVGTALFSGAAYWILNRRIGDTFYSAHKAIQTTGELLLPTLLGLSAVFVVLLGAAAAVITLYVSHHIAGPLFALRRYLENVARGELDFEPRLRTKDQTTPLAQSLSHALETLNARLVAIRSSADAVQEASRQISTHLPDGAGTEECRRDLATLLARGEELHREIKFFTLRGSAKG